MVAHRMSKFRAWVCTNSDHLKSQPRYLVRNRFCPQQPGAAIRTKTTHILAHHFAGCAEVFGRAPGNLECVRRYIKNRSVPSAADFLAVAAMTIERHNRFRGNFIANRAAGAATCNSFHFVISKLMKCFRINFNSSLGRDAPGCPISFCRSHFRFQRFRFAIPRRRIGDK